MRAAVLLVAIAAMPLWQAQAPHRPIFRGGVEVVVTDVVVLSRDGHPVRDLGTADFVVEAGGRRRRVSSAVFVGRPGREQATSPPVPLLVPHATTNLAEHAGRSVVFVIDVDGIRAGEGRVAMQAIADRLDAFDPADYLGLVALPTGEPRVDLTTDRPSIRRALARIAGGSNADRNSGEMTIGEATQIAAGDVRVLAEYLRWEDERKLTPEIIRRHQMIAERVLDGHRRRSRVLLDALGALADSMAGISGQKSIVLVTEGVHVDRDTIEDLRTFAKAAERSRVTLYALQLDTPGVEAAYGVSGAKRVMLDRDVWLDGLVNIATSTGGAALRSAPAAALQRVAAETAGYYLVTFEREPDDRDGREIPIAVRVNREGVTVRARAAFTPGSTRSGQPIETPRDTIGRLLRQPVSVSGLGMSADTFAMPVSAQGDEMLVVVSVRLESRDSSIEALGWEVIDESGRPRADAFEARPALSKAGAAALYLGALNVPPGRYQLKLAAVSSDGDRGSVLHQFDVASSSRIPIRMSDVLIGVGSGPAFRPSPLPAADAPEITIRTEMIGNTPEAFANLSARLQIRRADASGLLMDVPAALESGNSPVKRVVETTLGIQRLPPGDYIVRVVLAGGAEVLQRERLLRK